MQTSLSTSVRTQVRDSRDARAARTRLERELAGYNTAAELNDLHAILDRYSDQETADIRRILAAQQVSPRGDLRRPAADLFPRQVAPAPHPASMAGQSSAEPPRKRPWPTVFRLSAILGWSAMATTAFMAIAGERFAALTLLTISASAFAAAGLAAAFLPPAAPHSPVTRRQ